MSRLAETFFSARRQTGMQLQEIERATRIRASILQALENDDFQRLPPPVYTRGFVRNYATFLDLDPDQMNQLYDEAIGYRPQPVNLTAREPIRIAGLMAPNVGAIAVIIVLASIVVVWSYSALFANVATRPQRLPTPLVPTPTALAALVLPTATATPAPAEPTAATTPVATPATTERNPTALAASTPGISTAPASRAALPTPGRGSVTPTVAPTGLALRVRIVDLPSWVQIRSDGVVVFSGTLPPGTDRTFNAKSELFIHAGRSDAVDLVLNGVPQGRLGGPGQAVVRKTFTRAGIARNDRV